MVKKSDVIKYTHSLVRKRIDHDLEHGSQCVDLINHVLKKFFNVALSGNAIDLLNSAKKQGWEVVYDAQGVNPRAGAVFVTREAYPYGHTGWVLEDSNGVTIKTLEQNVDGYHDNNRDGINDQLQFGGDAKYITRGFGHMIGWFYPPYEEENGGNNMSKKVLLIAGHGAGDPGAVGGGYTEEGITRDLVKAMIKLAPQFDYYDFDRNCFADNGLKTLAHEYDEVVEFHLDATGTGQATGGHTIIYAGFTPDETDKRIQSVVNKWVGTHRGHVRNGGFSYRNNLQNLNVAAQIGKASYRLVELGFIDNARDRDIVVKNIESIARDFVNALNGTTTNEQPKPTPQPQIGLKPLDEVAKEVMLGRWGNGKARIQNLSQAGYNAEAVQKRVDEIKGKNIRKTTDEIAREVLNGRWGNGKDRIDRLKNAGYNPQEVQDKVNKLLNK